MFTFREPPISKAQYESKEWVEYCIKHRQELSSLLPSFMTPSLHRDNLDAENISRINKEKLKQPTYINEMPTEILLHIFSQAVPSSAIDPFNTTAGPWALSNVCKKWDSIITSYAPLWTSITIDTSPKAINVLNPYRCLLDILKRSQDQPLSIHFVEGEDSLPYETHTLLRILVKHAPRWKKLDFTFSNPETIAVLNAIRGRLDSLESLTFSASPGITADMPWSATPCRIFADAPKLRSATVSVGGFTLELPFAQLKSFSDHWCGARAKEMSIPEGITKYLREMEQVEVYRLYGPELKNATTPMADNIRLPFLRTFYAGDPRVLRSVITPRLEEVHVQPFNKEYRGLNLPVLLFLIERSSCSLRKIILGDCIPVVTKFISLLRASPALEELALSYTEWDDRMDSYLMDIFPSIHVKGVEEGEEGGTLVPRLTKINILVQHKDMSRTVPSMSFLRDTLIAAVENRRNHQVAGVAKLADVEVRAAILVKQDVVVSPGAGNVERWNGLKEGGMEALFHVLGGKPDDKCTPANSRMLRAGLDFNSQVYLQREYV